MKKILIATTFLATGTLVSNAATLIHDFSSASSGSISGNTFSVSNEGLTFTATTTSSGFKTSGVSGSLADWNKDWDSTSMNELNGKIPGASAAEGWKDYIYSSSKSGSITFTVSGLEAGSECSFVLFTGTPKESAGSWNSMTAGASTGVTSSKIGTSASSSLTDYELGAQKIAVENGTALWIEAVANDAGEVTFTLNSTAGWHSTSLNYFAFNGTAAVPEPSTFGLLTGLGALALVVSRRRRSRKIA